MRVNRGLFHVLATGGSVVCLLSTLTVALAGQRDAAKIRIKNFGCINENFYRGAQPRESDYADLSAAGVKTVIDLQEDGEAREQKLVEAAGMRFYRIGLSDSSWPSNEKAAQFLKLVNDPANQPVFIHCHGGKHRAGAMTAIYRMTHDGWSADRAYSEMKQYDFESGFGHSALRAYVYDYYSRNSQKGIAVTTDK
jgi:protein tyrosine/serine phosphatase